MTDRYRGVLVTFEKPIREDDYEASVGPLLGMLDTVRSVQPLKDESEDHFVRMARDREWESRLHLLILEMNR